MIATFSSVNISESPALVYSVLLGGGTFGICEESRFNSMLKLAAEGAKTLYSYIKATAADDEEN